MQQFFQQLYRNLLTILPLICWLVAYRVAKYLVQTENTTFWLGFGAVSFLVLLWIIWFMGGRLRARLHPWPFGPFYPHEFLADALSLLILFGLVSWL
jgi:hypothetical protein